MKKIAALCCVLIMFMSTSYGQSGSVKGTVTDTSGEALIGATIQIEGTTQAVVTDINGYYELPNVPTDGVLVYSYIGMSSQTIQVHSRSVVDVVMESDIAALDEVIVIGYGTTTKRKAVGAVSTLSSEKIENTTFSNVASALQGQVPGLIVQSSGGSVNSNPSISIRGGGTPLYVIDGIISTANAFNALNASDIESMSFLKDASATAVYGSQAGDGIVLIKTKRGALGEGPSVTYAGTFSISSPTVNPDRLNSTEFMEQANIVGNREYGAPYYTDDEFALVGNDWQYPDNNWYDMLFKDQSFAHNHNVSISGGSEDTNYYVSLGNYNTNGLLRNDLETMNRTNFRSNVTTKFDKIGLELTSGLSASIKNSNVPSYSNYSSALYNEGSSSPLNIAYTPDGEIYSNGMYNPLIYFAGEGYNDQSRKDLNAHLDATWRPKSIEGLSIGGLLSYSADDYLTRNWAAYPEMYKWDEASQTSIADGMYQSPTMTVTSGYSYRFDMEGRIAYLRTFGKHTFDGLLLYTQRQNFSDFVKASRTGYSSSAIDQLAVGPISGMGSDGYSAEGASAGLVFRAKYDYDSKYIFEFSGRYDGNDNFAEGQKWGFFPSYSGVWVMSDEAFMQGLVDRDIINFMKVRASYGTTGISSGTDLVTGESIERFGYLSNYDFSGNYFNADSGYVEGIEEGSLVDPDNLSWYTRTSLNYGVDITFLSNKLELSLDYFFYETDGFLCSPTSSYSDPLGASLPMITSDTNHRREGFEVTLRYKNNFGDWSIDVGGNISYYNQMFTSLDSESLDVTMNPYTRLTQQTDYYATAYVDAGLYQSMDEILNSARLVGSTALQCGEIKYSDENGDGQIDSKDERRFEMPYEPHINYGIDFNIGYKGFALSALIQGTGSMATFMGASLYKCAYQYGVFDYMSDRWSPTNTDARFPIYTDSQSFNGSNNSQLSSFWFEDAKYLRLKNLSLSYDLKNVMQNVDFIKGLTISLTGNNLLTFSAVKGIMDPEAGRVSPSAFGETNVNNSVAGSYTPMYKTYSMGVNVKF